MILLSEEEIEDAIDEAMKIPLKNRPSGWDIVKKAQLKKVVEDYTCEECSTPGFIHLVLPRKPYEDEINKG